MGRLAKTGELGRRNQGDVPHTSPSNNNRFLLIDHLIQDGSKIFAQTGVRRFTRHGSSISIVQHSCTLT